MRFSQHLARLIMLAQRPLTDQWATRAGLFVLILAGSLPARAQVARQVPATGVPFSRGLSSPSGNEVDGPPVSLAADPAPPESDAGESRTTETREPVAVANVSPADTASKKSAAQAELLAGVRGLESQAKVLRHVIQFVRPAAVHISAEKRQTDDKHGEQLIEEAGAGVLVQLAGKSYVLTNCHVISGAPVDRIRLRLASGRTLRPTAMLLDPESDVGLLAVHGEDLTYAKLGNSDQLEIGDYVLAIGSPFGLSHSVTQGIVSARGRSNLALGLADVRIQDFLQTDAAINPGNSGGPLLNLRGEVIGVNTAIASDSGVNAGVGFAIPINIARQIAMELATNGRVRRGYLGIEMDAQFNREQCETYGLPSTGGSRVTRVSSGSPAEASQLRIGDIIWAFGGATVNDDQHLVNLVALSPIEQPIPIIVYRDGSALDLRVILTARR